MMRWIRCQALLPMNALALLASSALPPAVYAQAQTYSFNIPADDLGTALRTFARQAHQQVVFDGDVTRGKTSLPVMGTYTASDAIHALLSGTGLTVHPGSKGEFMVAVASDNSTGLTEYGDQSEHLPEILVKGSPILNVDLKRTANDVQPYYVLDAQQIQQSGAVNVEDFLKQRLTMNTTVQSANQMSPNNSSSGNTSSINLRGLGTNETLVLIDGRRSAGVVISGAGQQPDINAIPLSAIERIEVLPSSASAIYGGAALGGVVNVILKKNYTGGDIKYSYENVTSGSAPLRTLGANYGMSLWDGKTQISVAGQYSDGNPLVSRDRTDLIQSAYSRILANDPGFFTQSPASPILGATANIGSADGTTNLTVKGSGAPLNSPIAKVANGSSGVGASSIVPGQWNYAPAPTAQLNGLNQTIGSVPRIKSLLGSVRQEITSSLSLFADFSTKSNSTTAVYNPFGAGGGVFVPASSPVNPFNQDVEVNFPNSLTPAFLTDSVTQSVTVGGIARLPRDWTSELDYTWSKNSFETSGSLDYDGSALGSAIAAGTINPFVDTVTHPLGLTSYLGHYTAGGTSTLNDLGLRASGPIGSLPWGRPTLTIGLEHRLEGFKDSDIYISHPLSPQDLFHGRYFGQSQTTDSVYAEALIPLVTSKNALTMIRSLELQLAARAERYAVRAGTTVEYLSPQSLADCCSPAQGLHRTINYTSTNPTIGLKYKPVDDLTLRASYARAFLPPTATQFLPDPTIGGGTISVTDPRNGQTYGVLASGGGNPNLRPQTSADWDLGLIFEPHEVSLKGLRVDFEYYRITQANFITTPSAQQVVDTPDYASRVIRDPVTGLIKQVDLSLLNATQFKTSGFDLTLDYRRPTEFGTFDFHVLGTLIQHDLRQYTIGGPSLDYVGFPSEGGEGKYKSNATLEWEYRQWTAGWTTLYSGSYRQFGAVGGPFALQNGGPLSYYTAAQGADVIPSQVYHDVFGSYDSRKRGSIALSNVTLQLGIHNLLNKKPPFDVFYNPYYYSPYGSARLRSYWIALSKSF